jgi:16S rRNA C1402 N4-methylase RsmH
LKTDEDNKEKILFDPSQISENILKLNLTDHYTSAEDLAKIGVHITNIRQKLSKREVSTHHFQNLRIEMP